MDFSKINNEFLEIQKKLSVYEEQKIKVFEKLKKDEKDILKLETKINNETDIVNKSYLQLLIIIKKQNYSELYDIFYSNKKAGGINE